LFLIPQVYNAKRFEVDLEKFPTISKVYDKCMKNDAFISAAPENQIDCPKE
jgi:maleylpyruvate isomerase